MKWISPADELPPQGKKILYLKDGDCYVVQRFADLWLPIPFTDSKYSQGIYNTPPDLWADIEMPNGLTGKVRMQKKGHRICDMDEFEMFFPEDFAEFVEGNRKIWENRSPPTPETSEASSVASD